MGQEKRRCERLSIPAKISYRITGLPKITTKLIDISGGGSRIKIHQELPVGEKINIQIHVPGRADPFIAKVKIVWLKKSGRTFHWGQELVKIKKREEFAEFICDKIICKSLDCMAK